MPDSVCTDLAPLPLPDGPDAREILEAMLEAVARKMFADGRLTPKAIGLDKPYRQRRRGRLWQAPRAKHRGKKAGPAEVRARLEFAKSLIVAGLPWCRVAVRLGERYGTSPRTAEATVNRARQELGLPPSRGPRAQRGRLLAEENHDGDSDRP
jgi:hypothetical protein